MAASAQALAHWREAAADLRAALALDPGDAELTAALAAVEADAAEARAEARVARRVQEAGEPGAAGRLETHSPGADVQDADMEPVPACGAPDAAGGAEEGRSGAAARAASQAAGEAAQAAAATPASRGAAPDARDAPLPLQQAPDMAALHRVAALVHTLQGLAGMPGCRLAWLIVYALQ